MIKKDSIPKKIWWILLSPINYLRANWRIIKYMWKSSDEFYLNMYPLYLANLQLRRLPFLLRFVKVKQLLFGDNRLSRLPKWLIKKQDLVLIDLAYNYFTTIPPIVFELKNLESLYIGGNDLKHLSERLKTLPNLTYLSVPESNLSVFPIFLCDCILLQGLDFSRNVEINHIPPEIGQLENLNTIFLEGTSIQMLPLSMRKIGLIRKSSTVEKYWHGGILIGKNDPKRPLHAGYFHSNFSLPTTLKYSTGNDNLADCFKLLKAIVPKKEFPKYLAAFWNERFKYLIEQGENYIWIAGPSIDVSLIDWSLLQHSQISAFSIFNGIKTIPEAIGTLHNLEKLHIHDVRISYLPKSFAQLTNLTDFSIKQYNFPFEVDIPEDATPQEEIQHILERQAQYHLV